MRGDQLGRQWRVLRAIFPSALEALRARKDAEPAKQNISNSSSILNKFVLLCSAPWVGERTWQESLLADLSGVIIIVCRFIIDILL